MSTSIATPSEIVIGNHLWQVKWDLATILFLEAPIGSGGLGDLALDLAPLGKVTPAHSEFGVRYSIKASRFEGALEASLAQPGTALLTLTRPAERGMITYSTLAGQTCALWTALLAVVLDDDMTFVVAAANAAGELGNAVGRRLGGEWGAPPKREDISSAATAAPGPAPWQTLFRLPGLEPGAGHRSA